MGQRVAASQFTGPAHAARMQSQTLGLPNGVAMLSS
jgi:hypothetical protein